MKFVIFSVALVIVVSGQVQEDPLCNASNDVKNKYLTCMVKSYQPAFQSAITCSSELGATNVTDFIHLSCGKLRASKDQEDKYGKCLSREIHPSTALSEDELSKVVETCRQSSMGQQ